MGEHCQYVVFPNDGRDPFVVESHPYDYAISDDLGGAVAAPITLQAAGCAVWVREDAATTGHQRNPVAGIMASLLNGGKTACLVIGPAVLTRLVPVGWAEDGSLTTSAEGFDGIVSAGLARVAADVRAALAGSDGPFDIGDLPADWPAKVRRFAQRLAAKPVAEDWPDSEGRPEPCDHISAALEQKFPGRRFVPIPAP